MSWLLVFEGQFDVVAGVEARGFLLASALAYATDTGVMTVQRRVSFRVRRAVSTRWSTVARRLRFTVMISRRVLVFFFG